MSELLEMGDHSMGFDWQTPVALTIVALAIAWYGRALVMRIIKPEQSTGHCGDCHGCKNQSTINELPLVTLKEVSEASVSRSGSTFD